MYTTLTGKSKFPLLKTGRELPNTPSTAGVSNSNCAEGQMKTYKVTRGPHYDADSTMALLEPR